jgi:hypothetical protein
MGPWEMTAYYKNGENVIINGPVNLIYLSFLHKDIAIYNKNIYFDKNLNIYFF